MHDGPLDLLLNQVAAGVTRIANEALTPLGIGLKQHSVLRLLAADGVRSQQSLSDALGIDRSTMVLVIDDLEAQGLVERRRNAADRRAYEIHLLPAGRERLRASEERARTALRDALGPLGADERAELHRLLSRVARALDGPGAQTAAGTASQSSG